MAFHRDCDAKKTAKKKEKKVKHTSGEFHSKGINHLVPTLISAGAETEVLVGSRRFLVPVSGRVGD